MAIQLINTPYRVHTAYNPSIAEYQATNNEANLTRTFQIWYGYATTPNYTISLKKDFLNNKAYFDISKLIKNYITNMQVATIYPDIILDHNLFVKYSSSDIGTSFGINAVKQIGISSNLESELATFRTTRRKLPIYDGFPLSVTILGNITFSTFGATASTQIYYDGETSRAITDPYFTVNIQSGHQYLAFLAQTEPLQANNGETIYANDGTIIEVSTGDGTEKRIYFEQRCTPQSPFYVRWVNRQGGWDYFMFSRRQTISRKTSGSVTFSPNFTNNESIDALEYEIDKQGEETITAGAEQINREEYESLKYLSFSPKIQYFDKQKNRWFGIIPYKDDNTEDTMIYSQSIEFEFKLPVQMQF